MPRKTGKQRSSNTDGPAVLRLLRTRRTLIASMWLAAFGLIAYGALVGIPKLEAYAVDASRPQSADITVELMNAPEWMTHELKSSLERRAMLEVVNRSSALARSELLGIQDSLMASGWFEQITQVRRINPESIQVHARFVKPFALIRDQHGDHFVDRHGYLLPAAELAASSGRAIVLVGPSIPRPSRPGEPWSGTDVLAGLKLLDLILTRPWSRQVSTIDISRYADNRMLTVNTNVPCTILWGRAPGDESPSQVPTEQKLATLDSYYHETGRIDRNEAGILDITIDPPTRSE